MEKALTFDDVALVPQYTTAKSRKNIDLRSRFTRNIYLNTPLISSCMDSVTEDQMCIAMARKGGIGILHRYCSIEEQVEMVRKVKRAQNIIIENPYTISKECTLQETLDYMNHKKVNTLIITSENNSYKGMLDKHFLEDQIRRYDPSKNIKLKNFPNLTREVPMLDPDFQITTAIELMSVSGNKKLPIIDQNNNNKLLGLITLKDIENKSKYPLMSLDDKGRLLVGVAVGIRDDYLERLEQLIKAEADVVVLDTAYGNSEQVITVLKRVKQIYPDIDFIVGNVCSGEGYKNLVEAGADGVRIGIGSSCFSADTRVLMGNGTYKNICDIKVGDYVINKDGNAVKVKNVLNMGKKMLSKIRINNWYKYIYATADHKFWIGDCSTSSDRSLSHGSARKILDRKVNTIPKTSKYKWYEIGKVNISKMFSLFPNKVKWKLPDNFTIDLSKYVIRGKIDERVIYTTGKKNGEKTYFNRYLKSNYNLGYIFGTFLGDGHAHIALSNGTEIGSSRWYFTDTEKKSELNIANKLKKCIESELDANVIIHRKDNISTVNVMVYNKPLTKILYSFGKRTDKHLPKEYYCNDKEYVQGLFDGLVDSDGYIENAKKETHNDRIGFINTSEYLIELFGWCCMNLNISFSSQMQKMSNGIIKGRQVKGIKQAYQIRCHRNNRFTKNYIYSRILEYEPNFKSEEVWDIEVDCPTHSFIANNNIVHNSICSTRLVSGFGMPQITALLECKKVKEQYNYDVPIISDGGIKKSGDIVKALVAGADTIMMGTGLSGTDQSAGKIIYKNGVKGKVVRGMAGTFANLSKAERTNTLQNNDEPFDIPAEGIDSFVEYKGSVYDILDKYINGIKSGVSYGGGTLEQLKKVRMVEISSAGKAESGVKEFL